MQCRIEMPTPQELTSLSVNDLCERKQQLLNQMYECVRRGESASELSKVYRIYQDEWLVRLRIGIHKYRRLAYS
jgi:hypothetical protein